MQVTILIIFFISVFVLISIAPIAFFIDKFVNKTKSDLDTFFKKVHLARILNRYPESNLYLFDLVDYYYSSLHTYNIEIKEDLSYPHFKQILLLLDGLNNTKPLTIERSGWVIITTSGYLK